MDLLLSLPASLSLPDLAALILLFAIWFGIGWFTERPPAGKPSVSVLMMRFRREWMLHFITRDPRIFDGNILASLREGTAFFASACMIATGGILALIGNTDRHPDNWGFLVRQRLGQKSVCAFAPAFDNGTSLGYEHPEAALAALRVPDRLLSYIRHGTHHCGWDTAEDGPASHMDLCARLIEAYPEARAAVQSVLDFEDEQADRICEECTRFNVSIPFTLERAAFVAALIKSRKAQLAALAGV